jgi:hypothetical protein
MNIDFGKMVKNVSQVKLKGGVFEKASRVIIIVSVCIFGIAALLGNIWVSCGAIGLIFIFAFVMLWRLINFANKNPQAALLEGAEFLVHQQIVMAAKGIGEFPKTPNSLTEDAPIVIDDKTQSEANKPDVKKGKEGQDA